MVIFDFKNELIFYGLIANLIPILSWSSHEFFQSDPVYVYTFKINY